MGETATMITRTTTMLLLALAMLAVPAWAAGEEAAKVEADEQPDKPRAIDPSQAPGVAVVELFTSEGCSSCPPADLLLAKIAEKAEAEGIPILTLAFHVDYWDRLGWKDPFADARYSARQKRYARAMKNQRGLYTPQMVVGGQVGFVGSSPQHASKAVSWALSNAQPASLALSAAAGDAPADVAVRFQARDVAKGAELFVAAVQTRAVSEVTKGENQGKTLTHVNVVRQFARQKLDPGASDGEVTLTLPAGIDRDAVLVVGFVQHARSLQVLGAPRRPVAVTPDKGPTPPGADPAG
jgi:hypothetical protein